MRYHEQSGTYYLQIWDRHYHELAKQERLARKRAQRCWDKRYADQQKLLNTKRRRLLEEKWRAEYYVKISPQDIPEHMHIRPIYHFPGRILTVKPEQYRRLLDILRENEAMNKED